ncbi:hypothetical protein [Herbaspirillum rhizosphaerae]|uniref:hypothetical protein n=1 Tax=Herbaspirillum rhizosphaerae TaxID=346179 RepID=UPI00067AC703|nr:hypothetical protein [Herbaspirillum rhizosphaerae]
MTDPQPYLVLVGLVAISFSIVISKKVQQIHCDGAQPGKKYFAMRGDMFGIFYGFMTLAENHLKDDSI